MAMMKQTVVSFVYGLSREGVHNTTPIEDQINEFLRRNQDHTVRSMSTIVTGQYQEALVVFDIREGKENRPNGSGGNQRKT